MACVQALYPTLRAASTTSGGMLKIGYAAYGPPRWAIGVSNSHTAMSEA